MVRPFFSPRVPSASAEADGALAQASEAAAEASARCLAAQSGRGEARRRAMLEAAASLFLERGFEGTTLADVVKCSGGSLATLYAWFGSKEGLFEAIVGEVSAQMVEPLDEPAFESLPIDQALRAFGVSFLTRILEPETLRWHRMCLAEGHKYPELRTALMRTGPGRVRERLAAYLETQVQAGRLKASDPMGAATHFFALVKSEQHTAAMCGEPVELSADELRSHVARAVDVFLYGYSAT